MEKEKTKYCRINDKAETDKWLALFKTIERETDKKELQLKGLDCNVCLQKKRNTSIQGKSTTCMWCQLAMNNKWSRCNGQP